jgi:hypothetical protein
MVNAGTASARSIHHSMGGWLEQIAARTRERQTRGSPISQGLTMIDVHIGRKLYPSRQSSTASSPVKWAWALRQMPNASLVSGNDALPL